MQQYGKFTITSQDPQDWKSETRKNQKPCLACNDKSNFTTIRWATMVSCLLISRAPGIV